MSVEKCGSKFSDILVKTVCILCLLSLRILFVTSCTPIPPCRSCGYVTIERDNYDCNRYYYCYHGRLWTRMRCGFNQIYSLRARACVYQFTTTECSQPTGRPPLSLPTIQPTTWPNGDLSSTQPISNVVKSTSRPIVTGSREYPLLSPQCGVKATSRIVGGSRAEHGEWGWQASIRIFSTLAGRHIHFCGGALIHPEWVVTAGHCVYGVKKQSLRVVMGAYDLSMTSPDEQTREILHIALYPKFKDYGNYPNDIALLQLATPVTMSRSVSTVCIPAQGEKAEKYVNTPRDTGCWVTGWGRTQGTGSVLSLNEVALNLVDLDLCSQRWPGYIQHGHLCAGQGDKGACKGDSGGPLVCSKAGRYFLQGVVSWGEDTCTLVGYPNVFTRVALYTDWIQKLIARTEGRTS